MMQTLVPALAEWGVPREDLHFEAFGPASVKLPGAHTDVWQRAPAAPVEVRFSRSGRTLAWDGQDANLLDLPNAMASRWTPAADPAAAGPARRA